MSLPKYVIKEVLGKKADETTDIKDVLGKKAGERTDPFSWMIDGFSIIAKRGADSHYSKSFTACGVTWKLRLRSILEEGGEKCVGLYLSLDNSDSKNYVIKATYNLFIYDQLQEEHIQKKGEDYFHSTSLDGCCCKIALDKFNSPKSGLLVGDRCIFGVDVLEATAFKLDKKRISDSLSLNKDLTPRIYTWEIKDVSKSNIILESEAFVAGGYNWNIWLYPNLATYKDFLGVFLNLDYDAANFASKTRVYAEFSLCLMDQNNSRDKKFTAKHWFSSKSPSLGWPNFLSWKEVQDPWRGFLLNDTCIVEATVVVLDVDIIA
ncbi:ubiquitin C-terminal hydrolase 12-like [Curcuma longa]|uniref:ubiquitin C-terminal hydrolase 12-like n=1 Tax=Curcuma longa TaxID=136217 RepID=UPI003D9F08EE